MTSIQFPGAISTHVLSSSFRFPLFLSLLFSLVHSTQSPHPHSIFSSLPSSISAPSPLARSYFPALLGCSACVWFGALTTFPPSSC